MVQLLHPQQRSKEGERVPQVTQHSLSALGPCPGLSHQAYNPVNLNYKAPHGGVT